MPTYVQMAAQQIGLTIDPSLLDGVAEDFERINVVASFLMEFQLDLGVEAAPVFQP